MLRLEQLESRLVPSSAAGSSFGSGNFWPNPQLITISFVPDGTIIGQNSSGYIYSNLFATFNPRFGSALAWQNQILKAAQTWAQATNVNFAVIPDNGSPIGAGNDMQGDPAMGDIRIGGYNMGTSWLAAAYQPPQADNYSIAGDIQFNTAKPFNIGATFDLYTVALHEIGHSLGLNEATVLGAAMYTTYNGVKPGLATDDIQSIQSIAAYGGARQPDAYNQGGASNGSLATAADLTALVDPIILTGQVNGLYLASPTGEEDFSVTAPAGTNGTFQVNLQSQGLSLLSPNLTVYAADQTTVLGSASGAGHFGANLTVTLNNVMPGQQFFLKVTGADPTALGTGLYALNLDFGPNQLPTVASPSVELAAGTTHISGGGQASSTVPDSLLSGLLGGSASTYAETPQAVAMDANGNYVVTWAATDALTGHWDVLAQRFDVNGNAQGGLITVASSLLADNVNPAVAMDAAGDFVVTWSQSGSPWQVYAQRYNSSGNAQGGAFRVETDGFNDQKWSSVAMDTAGDFVVTWTKYDAGAKIWKTMAQRYNSAGAAQGGNWQVNASAVDAYMSRVAMDATGDFVITWTYNYPNNGTEGISGRRYNSAGVAQGNEFRVNTIIANNQDYSSVSMDAVGDFVVSWTDYSQGTPRIEAQQFNANGTMFGIEFQVNADSTKAATNSAVAMESSGTFVVVYQVQNQGGTGWQLWGRQYDKLGVTKGHEFMVNSDTTGNNRNVSIARDANMHAVIVWTADRGAGGSSEVFLQRAGAGAGASPMLVDGDPMEDPYSPETAQSGSLPWSSGEPAGNAGPQTAANLDQLAAFLVLNAGTPNLAPNVLGNMRGVAWFNEQASLNGFWNSSAALSLRTTSPIVLAETFSAGSGAVVADDCFVDADWLDAFTASRQDKPVQMPAAESAEPTPTVEPTPVTDSFDDE
jgi:hypothetical protein